MADRMPLSIDNHVKKEWDIMKKTFIYIILIAVITAFMPAVCFAGMFPDVLENKPVKTDERKETEKGKSDGVEVTSIKYNNKGVEVEGLLVYPKNSEAGKTPAILFIHTPDETPQQQLWKMKYLAERGYVVMCAPWKTRSDCLKAYEILEKLGAVDHTLVSVMGAHDGATQAIAVAIENRRKVKALISISGRPPFDMLKEGQKKEELAKMVWAAVLVVHGEVDTQLPVTVSRYFAADLKFEGRIVDTFVMPFSRHYYNEMEWAQILKEADKFIRNYVINVPEDKKYDPAKVRHKRGK